MIEEIAERQSLFLCCMNDKSFSLFQACDIIYFYMKKIVVITILNDKG